jgi:hypothetical protein
MDLLIKIKNGQPFEHPITRENFNQVWPENDFDNPGANFAKFERIQMPVIGVYEIIEGSGYRWNGDIVQDYWLVREMTNEEKLTKQNEIKQIWYENNNFQSWSFDEELCEFIPPVPMPNDEKKYRWDEETINWTEVENVT